MNPAAAEAVSISALEEQAYAKVTPRLVPLLFFSYVAAFLDRVNIGYAKLQMASDLHFSDSVYGFGAGIFFIGYFVFQIPSNLMLQRIGARAWLGSLMIIWGVISAAMFSVTAPAGFYALRFLLGMAEGGFFPGTILFLTTWYPARRRARIIASFMTAIALSGVIGSPLSGWIMDRFAGQNGWAGWQWLFLLEAIPSVAAGILSLLCLTDSIDKARWLTPPEKALLREATTRDHRTTPDQPVLRTLFSARIWRLAVINFAMTTGLYGITFWLPQIIANAGVKDILKVGLLGAIPYGMAAANMIVMGRRSDRMGERRRHLAFNATCGALGLIAIGLVGGETVPAMAALTVATAGVLAAAPLFWAWATGFFQGTEAAVSIACISSLGNLAGFFGPYLMGIINDLTHRTAPGLYTIAAGLLIGAALILRTPRDSKLPGNAQ